MDIVKIPRLSKGFQLIPSMAVMGKSPVWVMNGKYNPIKVGGKTVSPVEISRDLSNDFDILHYLDITGIRGGTIQWNIFQEVMDIFNESWADIGATFSDSIIDPLMSGASSAIISTKMMDSIEEIAGSFELTENIIVQIDVEDGIVTKDPIIKKMTVKELIRELSSLGIDTFILEQLGNDRNDSKKPMITEALGALPAGGRLFVGIDDIKEAKELDEMGIDGAIISVSRLIKGLR